MPGGTGAAQDPTPEVIELCQGLRAAALSAAQAKGWNGVFTSFEPGLSVVPRAV